MAGPLPPGLLKISQPGVEFDEGFAADVVDACSAVVLVRVRFDEAGVAEVAEVFADGWLAAVDAVGEVGDGAGLVGEFPDDRLPDGVAEQFERAEPGRRERVAVARVHALSGMHLFGGC